MYAVRPDIVTLDIVSYKQKLLFCLPNIGKLTSV